MVSVKTETPLFSDICRRSGLSFHVEIGQKNFKIFLAQGQSMVQAQPSFQAQPGFHSSQVQVLSGYSFFWPESHFTW